VWYTHGFSTGCRSRPLQRFGWRDQAVADAVRIPAGRMVTAEDVAAAIAFLCSPDAQMVRGHVLVVDGGESLLLGPLSAVSDQPDRSLLRPMADG
jgi:NAD(P)-dependent dehydrogenase (short-subunit alcohol dehydrogenase family)